MEIRNDVVGVVLSEAAKPFVLVRRGSVVDMDALRRALGDRWEFVTVSSLEADLAFFPTLASPAAEAVSVN